MRIVFRSLRRPRNPLLQMVLAVAAIGMLLFFSVFALVAAAGVVTVLALARAWRALSGRSASPNSSPEPSRTEVIEGEFTVVRDAQGGRPLEKLRYTQ